MNGWIVLWKVVLVLACALYFGVAVLVAIFGAGDIKSLLRREREES